MDMVVVIKSYLVLINILMKTQVVDWSFCSAKSCWARVRQI